jgi:ABC-2 type transport system permease protein
MSFQAVTATALRVLVQLRRDPRTIALLLAIPCILVTLLKYVFVDRSLVFDRIGGPLLGLFPFTTMFLVASITMLRERTTGTLERLMTLPLHKLDVLVGYAAAFGLVAAVQATVVSTLALVVLDLHVVGSPWLVGALAVANAVLGMSLGLFLSAFARTEFQAVQFMPAFVFPQLLLCGLIVPRAEMARALELASYCLPLSYAYDALDRVTHRGTITGFGLVDLGIVLGATIAALALGAATLRRRTP